MACFFGHKWNGCKCDNCGKTRDENHKYNAVSGTCEELCSVCGKARATSHIWVGCVCERCGKQSSYINFDFLDSNDLDSFVNVVLDSTRKWILAINIVDERKNELKGLLSRLEKCANVRPFKLVNEDVKIAIHQFDMVTKYTYVQNGSVTEIREGTNNQQFDALIQMFGGKEKLKIFYERLDILKFISNEPTDINPEKLSAPSVITITRPKLARNGAINNNKNVRVYLNMNEIGSFVAGEEVRCTTDCVDNVLALVGTDKQPIRFKATAGENIQFCVTHSVMDGSFVVTPEK